MSDDRSLEENCRALLIERDDLRSEIHQLQRQLAAMEEHAGRLQVRLNEATECTKMYEKVSLEARERCDELVPERDSAREDRDTAWEERDEARQVARDYRSGILRLDWYEWHEETVMADEAAAAEKYPWLKE